MNVETCMNGNGVQTRRTVKVERSACGWWVSMEMAYVQGPDTFVSMMYIWVPGQPSWDASTE